MFAGQRYQPQSLGQHLVTISHFAWGLPEPDEVATSICPPGVNRG
jgi:hypothetical protein